MWFGSRLDERLRCVTRFGGCSEELGDFMNRDGLGEWTRLPPAVVAWLEQVVGAGPAVFSSKPIPVIGRGSSSPANNLETEEAALPLIALRLSHGSVVVADNAWLSELRPVVTSMPEDLLFSTFGAYELGRVVLPYGYGVWGPTFYLFADMSTWRGDVEERVHMLGPEDLRLVDYKRFWHCYDGDATCGFGVMEKGELVALASVRDRGSGLQEIGMDVMPSARGYGLGRAVVGAAGTHILNQGDVVMATTAPFNVPSARTLRSVGLVYAFSEMSAYEGGFPIPPQPLGRPYPGAQIKNYYPEWAMNQDINPSGR
jgi:GNAT superfamily N-acetyltransferase